MVKTLITDGFKDDENNNNPLRGGDLPRLDRQMIRSILPEIDESRSKQPLSQIPETPISPDPSIVQIISMEPDEPIFPRRMDDPSTAQPTLPGMPERYPNSRFDLDLLLPVIPRTDYPRKTAEPKKPGGFTITTFNSLPGEFGLPPSPVDDVA